MTDNSNLSRRRFLQATGGAASAVALAGCTGPDEEEDPGQEETTEGTPEEGETSEAPDVSGSTLSLINSTMTTLDPIEATDTASGTVIQNVFDALMNYPNGEVEPEALLAADYETSDDFTTYTFTLKEGVKYHNGDEVTANDVVYSFERLAQSSSSHRQYFILDSIGVTHEMQTITTEEENEDGEMEEVEKEVYKPNSIGVTADGDYTVKIELEEPFHSTLPMLAYTSFSVIPEGIIGDIEGYDGELSQDEFATSNPVGAGPFKFETWEANTQAKISKFEDYHGDVAQIDGIHWQIIEDPNASYNYSQNKNSDIISMPTSFYDPNKISVEETDDMGRKVGTYGPMRNGETANYISVATINSFYIGFNTANVEKPARQAAAYAMNQQTMVDQVFKGRGSPAYHFTPPSIYPEGANAYTKHAEENYPYGYNESQLDKARQVMEEAGYGPDNRYSFTFTTYESETWQQMGGILRDQLTNAHIDMELESAPFSTLLKRGRNGNLQAYSLGWIMDWPAPDNFLQLLNPPQTDTSQPAPTSYLNWLDTEAASQAEEAWQTVADNPAPTDEAKQARNEAYITMEEANWEDVAFLNVYHRTDERFWYDWLDVPRFGGGGGSRQKHNHTTIGERN